MLGRNTYTFERRTGAARFHMSTNMNTSHDNDRKICASVHAEAIASMLDYIVDCRFEESDINTGNLYFALEYAYRPHLRFWRDLSIATVGESILHRFPKWRPVLEASGSSPELVLKELEEVVWNYAFSEANAEALLALPVVERPTSSRAAFESICERLAASDRQPELEYAMRDGEHCGEDALEALRCIQSARSGIVIDRIGTVVARRYRDTVVTSAL
jgi:hypothetical protein